MEVEHKHSMRLYQVEDYNYIHSALAAEGITERGMCFETGVTVVFDFGFFSYSMLDKMGEPAPMLNHFYVDPDKRELSKVIKMLKVFQKLVSNYHYFIAHVTDEKDYMKSFLQYQGGRPYMKRGDTEYYVVPLRRVKNASLH